MLSQNPLAWHYSSSGFEIGECATQQNTLIFPGWSPGSPEITSDLWITTASSFRCSPEAAGLTGSSRLRKGRGENCCWSLRWGWGEAWQAAAAGLLSDKAINVTSSEGWNSWSCQGIESCSWSQSPCCVQYCLGSSVTGRNLEAHRCRDEVSTWSPCVPRAMRP